MKYRKKPIVVEAIQWTEDNKEEIDHFVGKNLDYCWADTALIIPRSDEQVKTEEEAGFVKELIIVGLFSWVIKGIDGEFYPCADDVFKKTYDIIKP